MPDATLTTRPFERILLIKPSSLGDVVHALPVLHGLRVRYPTAHLAWLITQSLVPLVGDHPQLDEVITFDRSRYGRLGRSWTATRAFHRFVRDLRQRRFDLAIDLQGLFRSGFLARASGARVRLGFAEAREMAWCFYTHRLPPLADATHAVDRNWRVASALGFEGVAKTFDLHVADDERAAAERLLADAGVRPDQRRLAVFPGARWETKQWSAARFAAAIDQLVTGGEPAVILMGGPDEAARCRAVADQCRSEPINLAGRTDLRAMIAVVACSTAVLCHDSGPMHIAAALDKPLVSIVGPTNPIRTGPYGRLDSVLHADLACRPCYLRQLADCPHDHECMRRIDVDTVAVAVRSALQRTTEPVDISE